MDLHETRVLREVAEMCTVTEIVEDTLTVQKQTAKDKQKTTFCPPGYKCRNTKNPRSSSIFFKVIGMIVAVLAAFFIISTDSQLYLVFWVFYSVMRRMMMKSGSRVHLKTE